MSEKSLERRTERLKRANEEFQRANGKTPAEEARDSARMTGLVLLLLIVWIAAGGAYVLWKLWGLIGN